MRRGPLYTHTHTNGKTASPNKKIDAPVVPERKREMREAPPHAVVEPLPFRLIVTYVCSEVPLHRLRS